MKFTNIAGSQAKIVSLAIVAAKLAVQSSPIGKPVSQEGQCAGYKNNFYPIAISYGEWLACFFYVGAGSKLDS